MLANRPGELARVASRLGDQGINIDYGYSEAEPCANASFLILGVADAGKAVKLLEQLSSNRTKILAMGTLAVQSRACSEREA